MTGELYTMYKSKSREKHDNLGTRKTYWNQVIADVDQKLAEARKRVADLEFARRAFQRNAAKGAPIPGASDNTQQPSA